MCLFEYYIAIFLVMPGKPSFSRLDFNVGLRYRKRRDVEVPASNKNTSTSILRDYDSQVPVVETYLAKY